MGTLNSFNHLPVRPLAPTSNRSSHRTLFAACLVKAAATREATLLPPGALHSALRSIKKAELPATAPPTFDQAQAQKRSDLFAQLSQIGLTGLGLGAGARGLIGLKNMLSAKQAPTPNQGAILPVPVRVPNDNEGEPNELMDKYGSLRGFADGLVKEAFGRIEGASPLSSRWGIPAAVAAGTGGAVGGWHMIDWLLGQPKRDDLNDDLHSAETDYHRALSDQYQAAMMGKSAAATDIDALFDELCEKQAGVWDTIGTLGTAGPRAVLGDDNTEAVLGSYLAAAGLLATGSGMAAYDWTKLRSPGNVLSKAMAIRARQRATPPPVTAVYDETEKNKFPAPTAHAA